MAKGWVEFLDADRFELHLFALDNTNDADTALARSRTARFVQGLTSAEQWADAIQASSLDAIIYPEIGMDPMNARLACLRLAPVQATTWGHPETSGLPSIDYYLSAEGLEPEGAQHNYTERLVLLPNLSCSLHAVKEYGEKVSLDEAGIDTSRPIFVCPGTPFKYSPRYDFVYPEIAKRLAGRCQFLFFKHPNHNLTRLLMRRLESAFSAAQLNARDYLVELPWLKREHFFGLMSQAHAYLDTIGFSGFNTALQAVECGLPVITKDGRFMRGRLASGILKRIGAGELVANSILAFIDRAARIVEDDSLRPTVETKMALNRHVLYEDLAPVRALEEFLWKATAR